MTKAKETSDQAERTKLYEETQVIFKEEAPWADDRPLARCRADEQEGVRAICMSPLGDFTTSTASTSPSKLDDLSGAPRPPRFLSTGRPG